MEMSRSHDRAGPTVCDHRLVLKLASQLFGLRVAVLRPVPGVLSGSALSAHMTVSGNPVAAADWCRHTAHWSYNSFPPRFPEQRHPRNDPADQHVILLYNWDILLASHKFQTLVIHQGDPWAAEVYLPLHSRAEANPKCMESRLHYDTVKPPTILPTTVTIHTSM